jgi:hypothetical protein
LGELASDLEVFMGEHQKKDMSRCRRVLGDVLGKLRVFCKEGDVARVDGFQGDLDLTAERESGDQISKPVRGGEKKEAAQLRMVCKQLPRVVEKSEGENGVVDDVCRTSLGRSGEERER